MPRWARQHAAHAPFQSKLFLHVTSVPAPSSSPGPLTFTYLISSRNAPHISTLPSGLTIFTVKITIFWFQKLQIKGKSPLLSWEGKDTSFLVTLYKKEKKNLFNLVLSSFWGYNSDLVSHRSRITLGFFSLLSYFSNRFSTMPPTQFSRNKNPITYVTDLKPFFVSWFPVVARLWLAQVKS